MKRKAIIIGAGIAGPAIAMQLQEIGFDVSVFEARMESEMNQGVFLGITPNGLNVLKHFIDLKDLKKDFTSGNMAFYNSRDREIGKLDTNYQRERYGAETIQIRRSAISQLLRDESRKRGIVINYGYKLSKLVELDEKVSGHFENGQNASGDILIACDGAHSVTRSLLFPQLPKAKYTKMISTGAITSGENSDISFGKIKMLFGKRAFFAYALSNQGDVWWFNNYYREKEPAKDEFQTTLQQEIRARLLDIHRDDSETIRDIIRNTEEIFAYPIYEIPDIPKWHSRRICLIGDAAHATSPHIGQGASLALEDTIVLAKCLRLHNGFENAFAEFELQRKPRVEKLLRTARKIGNAKSAPNPVATFFRDLLLRHFIKFEIRKMDWVYGWNGQ